MLAKQALLYAEPAGHSAVAELLAGLGVVAAKHATEETAEYVNLICTRTSDALVMEMRRDLRLPFVPLNWKLVPGGER